MSIIMMTVVWKSLRARGNHAMLLLISSGLAVVLSGCYFRVDKSGEPEIKAYQESLANAEGDLAGALEADLAIAERLAARDPTNSEWQRDLFVSHWKLADLAEKRPEPSRAKTHLQEALRIAILLKDSGRLAPPDAWMVEALKRRLDALVGPAADGG